MRDRVYGNGNEWYAVVNGNVFGPWPLKQYAIAGVAVEQRRRQERKEFNMPQPSQDQWSKCTENLL